MEDTNQRTALRESQGLAIINILSCTASVGGFVWIYFNRPSPSPAFNWVVGALSLAALLFALYVLKWPHSRVVENASKLVTPGVTYYEPGPDSIAIQKGEFAFSGFGPADVQFPVPFAEDPTVEVLNVDGEPNCPEITAITANSFKVTRKSYGTTASRVQWLARGKPLVPKQ